MMATLKLVDMRHAYDKVVADAVSNIHREAIGVIPVCMIGAVRCTLEMRQEKVTVFE